MIRDLLLNQNNHKKIALIDDEKTYLYADLVHKAVSIQESLPAGSQGNVAIFLPNSSDFIASLFALALLGIPAFPLNCDMTQYEIIPLLKQASVCSVLTSTRFHALFEELQKTDLSSLQVVYMEELQAGKNETLVQNKDVRRNSPVVLLTTSGSTGKSRIVPLTEDNLLTSVYGYLDKMNFAARDSSPIRYLLASPLASAYGLMILYVCLIKAFPLILLKSNFTMDRFYQVAETYGATHYEGGASVLLMMEQLAGRPIPYDISRLKDFGFGGSKISGNTLRKLSVAFPDVRFWQGYGMTEAAPLIAKYANAQGEKLDSVGTAIKNVEIAIGSAGSITNTPHTYGEILIKGPNVMEGYYRDAIETRKVLKNGYLSTGDIGYLDEEGYLYICGRKKNIIIVRGFNVHPEEVESCILDSMLAKDCIVYGEANVSGDEYICADIVPLNPQVQIQHISRYCNTRLADYKCPQNIRLVDKIRKVASGKTDRSGNS